MIQNPKIILATQSTYRIELFQKLGLDFKALPHRCNEEFFKQEKYLKNPVELVEVIAREKALSLRECYPEDIIIGSDQVASFEGRIMGKPGTVEGAIEQLRMMRGCTHRLITAVAAIHPEHKKMVCEVQQYSLTMRELTDSEIRRYVERDRPLDCAGSYKIESLGIALFSAISGDDFTTIIGLPMLTVVSMLRGFGVSVF